jgi:cysteine desulfurase
VEVHQKEVQHLTDYMISKLKEIEPGTKINGETDANKSLYTVLNVCFPLSESNAMLLFSLDINGVAASGGSACSSGSTKGSHVLATLDGNQYCNAIRFSFSRYTTKEEIDFAVAQVEACTKVLEV